MDYETAHVYPGHMSPDALGERVEVGVPMRTGTHHTIALYERAPDGEHRESWRGGHPTRMGDLEIEARVGDVLYQRTTSPASAGALERYGMVLGDHEIDWGSDADWVVDFGPMGDATRQGLRSPTASPDVKRGRVTASDGAEVVGGAVEGTESAGGGSG